MKIISRSESKFFKENNPYYDTRSKYGREADTIVLFIFRTPTGRFSKNWAIIRFNSERNVANKTEQIEAEYDRLICGVFKDEVKRGYFIDEVVLYSGTI